MSAEQDANEHTTWSVRPAVTRLMMAHEAPMSYEKQ